MTLLEFMKKHEVAKGGEKHGGEDRDVRCPETSHSNPVKAIRMKCMDCFGGHRSEVDRCPVKDCALYPFRMGRNPFRAVREMTDEQKQAAAERLAKARAARA